MLKMIRITDKSKCCGCAACKNVCPKHCILMKEDIEGFLYPEVDASVCIDCGLCQQVCPILHQQEDRKPLVAYAAKNRNENIRLRSSSGGVFTLLAERVIDEGGVVFGARFDECWNVVHDCVETKEEIAALRGSKYVQSKIGDSYLRAKQYLISGRQVLFTGTPCQISGLKKYLGKEYDNLLTVDVVCHGVPSPKIWQMFLSETVACAKKKLSIPTSLPAEIKLSDINFRSKSTGWKKYSVALTLSVTNEEGSLDRVSLSSVFTQHPFMNAFLANFSLRPSCYACPAKSGKSESDITIADFWGIEHVLPEWDDDKGLNLVLGFTKKGEAILNNLSVCKQEVDYMSAVSCNSCMVKSVVEPVYRDFFFKQLDKHRSFLQAWNDCVSSSMQKRLQRLLYRKLKTFIH